MNLRKITAEDLDRTRQLRNENREWFFYSDYITEEQHKKWFSELKGCSFYVIEEDGEVIGTIGVTDAGEVGNLTMSNEHRGKGYMKKAIQELTKDGRDYYAKILPHNENSLRVFAKAGFVETSCTPDVVYVTRRKD